MAGSSVIAKMSSVPPIFTIGHSTRSIAEFVHLLGLGRVDLVVDVRTVPRSRRNPQFNEEVFAAELAPYQIGYQRHPGLGGLRPRSREVPASLNRYWDNQSFHNYADYALSEDFAEALGALLRLSLKRRCAVTCAEALWWRCHRRIIADYLLVRERAVFHLMANDRIEPAVLTPAARVKGGTITYPGEC